MVVIRLSQGPVENNNAEGKNQHLGCPPEAELRPLLTFYHSLGLNDKKITMFLLKHIDKTRYGLSISTVKRRHLEWGLVSTRNQKHDAESIGAIVQEIRSRFPFKGAEGMRKTLRLTYKMHVKRSVIQSYLKQLEPAAVLERRQPSRFKRCRYYAAGVNDIWAMDQHDKWAKKFQLHLHIGLDPFTGLIVWLKVWWTNSNPRLITKYYLDSCRKIGSVPVLTQSDPGTENNGVANAHTTIRQTLDPSLHDTLQHRFCRKTQNIKPEAAWSLLRRDFSPGFETTLEQGLINHWYDPDNVLQNLVFRWLAIPWIQAELNAWAHERNHSCVRRDKHKVLPHGIPVLINAHPEHFGAVDLHIPVSDQLFDQVEAMYAPQEHPVFQLVPPPFEARAQLYYEEMGQPAVSFLSFWQVYRDLLLKFEEGDGPMDVEFSAMLSAQDTADHSLSAEVVDILPGMKPYSFAENRQLVENAEDIEGAVMVYESEEEAEDQEENDDDVFGDDTLLVPFTDTEE